MTNKEFCKRLREAKEIACAIYAKNAHDLCIARACMIAGLSWYANCTFDKDGEYDSLSNWWVTLNARSTADIARVFDESIRALGEKP